MKPLEEKERFDVFNNTDGNALRLAVHGGIPKPGFNLRLFVPWADRSTMEKAQIFLFMLTLPCPVLCSDACRAKEELLVYLVFFEGIEA